MSKEVQSPHDEEWDEVWDWPPRKLPKALEDALLGVDNRPAKRVRARRDTPPDPDLGLNRLLYASLFTNVSIDMLVQLADSWQPHLINSNSPASEADRWHYFTIQGIADHVSGETYVRRFASRWSIDEDTLFTRAEAGAYNVATQYLRLPRRSISNYPGIETAKQVAKSGLQPTVRTHQGLIYSAVPHFLCPDLSGFGWNDS